MQKIAPYSLNKPDEIFYDTEEKQIVFVKFLSKKDIVGNKDCIKVPVIINSKDKKRPINYIGTMGRVNYNDAFKNTSRHKKIE